MVRVPLSPEEVHRGQVLGRLLRAARGERPPGDVAVAAGLSPETLRKIETGRISTPSFSTVAALADELDLSLDAVWCELREAALPETVTAGVAEGVRRIEDPSVDRERAELREAS